MFGLLSLLLVIALPVALIVWLVRASRREETADRPAWDVRRVLQHTFLLAATFTAASGVATLLRTALPDPDTVAGRPAAELAMGLSLTLVAVPAWVLLWRAVRGHLLREPQERASAAWALVLVVGATASLVAAYTNAVPVGRRLLGAGAFDGDALANAVVWTAVWAGHTWLLRHRLLSPTAALASLAPVLGSAVGLLGLAVGVGGALTWAFGQAYALVAGAPFVDVAGADALRGAVSAAGFAAPVWWWHWLRDARQGPRTGFWHAYVMLLPILGGLLTAVVSFAVGLHRGLQWLLGAPEAASAAVHFDVLPGALAGVAVGAAGWWYHHGLPAAPGVAVRTEPERAYEYAAAAVGLLAGAGGVTALVMAGIQAVAPRPLAAATTVGDTLAVALTMLAAGVPLWLVFWRRLEARARAGDAAELGAPSRRVYLSLLFGATGLTAVVSLAVILFVVLRDLLEGTLATTVLHDLRPALALVVTAGAVSWTHWRVHRRDRAVAAPGPRAGARTVLLLSPDGRRLAEHIAARTGAHVQALHRLDTIAVEIDEERVAAAVLSAREDRLLVTVEEDGTVHVIPYERA